MDGKELVDSVQREIIQPGIQRLMDTSYFTELRQGKLSRKRMQGWAIQHYLHNKAILRSFALGMVKNAQDPAMFDYFTYGWGMACSKDACDRSSRFVMLDMNQDPQPLAQPI